MSGRETPHSHERSSLPRDEAFRPIWVLPGKQTALRAPGSGCWHELLASDLPAVCTQAKPFSSLAALAGLGLPGNSLIFMPASASMISLSNELLVLRGVVHREPRTNLLKLDRCSGLELVGFLFLHLDVSGATVLRGGRER